MTSRPGNCDPAAPLIVGGGMAGALLALLLRHHGTAAVTLIESRPLKAGEALDTPSFDARSTALAAGTLAVLEQIGLLAAVLERAASINTVHVSRRARLGSTSLHAADQGLPRLGAVVENRWFGHVLLAALQRDPAITVRAPAVLTGVTRTEDGYTATLASGERIATPLLIAADGAGSRTREWLGISARHEDLGHDALIANLALAEPHNGIAYERFLDEGPLALLPLTEQRASLVWTGPRAEIQRWQAAPESDFLAAVQERLSHTMPRLARTGTRQCYPLRVTRACAQAIPYAVVVGNAAHTLHPVAGQGFNLTVRDLALLAETIGAAERPGELARLEQWRLRRRDDQVLLQTLTRYLPEWFRVREPLFAHGRQLGLLAMDLLPGLRRRFAQRAMGL